MADLRVLGSTGLRHYQGRIHEEQLRALRGDRWRRVVEEMLTDATVGAMLFAVEMLIRQVSWDVVPSNDSPSAQEAADFVRSCLYDMDLGIEDTFSEILTMLPWGWSYFEVVYKVRDGDHRDPQRRSKHDDSRIGWRRWGIRAQDTLSRWELSEDGATLGMHQAPPPTYTERYIPAAKAIHFRTNVRKNNPEGASVLRWAYRAWYYKTNLERIEGVGVERDLAGLPVAYVPPSVLAAATAEDSAALAAIQDIVTSIRRDEQEGVVFPQMYDDRGNPMYRLELLTSGGARQFDTSTIIDRYKSDIAQAILADFILLGHQQVGSYALSSDKTSLFAVALGAWLNTIADTINNQAVSRLVALNGWLAEDTPALVHGDVETVDLAALGQYVSDLTNANITFTDDEQAWLKRQAGMPASD